MQNFEDKKIDCVSEFSAGKNTKIEELSGYEYSKSVHKTF
jgi:hypothetical protein